MEFKSIAFFLFLLSFDYLNVKVISKKMYKKDEKKFGKLNPLKLYLHPLLQRNEDGKRGYWMGQKSFNFFS